MNWPMGWTSLEPLNEYQAKFWEESSAAAISGDSVRAVWFDHDPSQTPQRPRPDEQRPEERQDSVRNMPQPRAPQARSGCMQGLPSAVSAKTEQAGERVRPCLPFGVGPAIGAEALVPRVAKGVNARVARLKAIGNGQVPQCAAAAWRMLGGV